MAEPRGIHPASTTRLDEVPLPDEVDPRQQRAVGHARGAEERIDRSAALPDRSVDALPVREVERDLRHARSRRSLDVEHDDVRAELREHFGRRRPDPRRPADDGGPLPFVAELIRHFRSSLRVTAVLPDTNGVRHRAPVETPIQGMTLPPVAPEYSLV